MMRVGGAWGKAHVTERDVSGIHQRDSHILPLVRIQLHLLIRTRTLRPLLKLSKILRLAALATHLLEVLTIDVARYAEISRMAYFEAYMLCYLNILKCGLILGLKYFIGLSSIENVQVNDICEVQRVYCRTTSGVSQLRMLGLLMMLELRVLSRNPPEPAQAWA